MALTLAQHLATSDAGATIDGVTPVWKGTTFTTVLPGYLTEVGDVPIVAANDMTGNIWCDIYETSAGVIVPSSSPIATSELIDATIYTTTPIITAFVFDQTVLLSDATEYAWVVKVDGGYGSLKALNSNGYASGKPTGSSNGGSSWTAPSSSYDMIFTVSGEEDPAPISASFDAVSTFTGTAESITVTAGSFAAAATFSGSLSTIIVVAGSFATASTFTGSILILRPFDASGNFNAVSAFTGEAHTCCLVTGSFAAIATLAGSVGSVTPDAPNMIALAASVGDIDTTDQLMAFEAFQKVCVVNGKKKFIADFSNTLLDYTSGLTTPPLKGDILTQASSDAVMVVDFVDLTKKKIYGFRTTDEVFNTSNNITSNNVGDQVMNPASWTPDTVTDRTAGPLWYEWTRHPDGVFDLPTKAYIGCLYRGRAVLSGNPLEPYQWYMSRQGDIHDFDYVAGDAQTPVKGGNSNMGEIGDIVKALIPFKDDLLIFGCANNIYFAADDPAYGGTLNALDLTTGIYSQTAWCFTGDGVLWFWGTNGLYRTTIPGTPECITQVRLPDLVDDEAADPSTHRISLQFDRRANGIGIYITKLSNGENSNWFYDLLTEGFFPETYPTECGVYSSFYYPANNARYKGLILGGKDGHLRVFDRDAMSDDVGDTDVAIDSYVTLSPIPLSKNLDKNGEFSGWNILAGGDSSDIYFKAYIGRTPDEVIDKIVADGYPAVGGNFVAPGRRANNKRTQKITGAYLGIKLGNNTTSESWSFEKFYGTVKPSGRIK